MSKMNQEFKQELEKAKGTVSEIRAGHRVSHRDIADAYGYLLVSNLSTVYDEAELVTVRIVFHELWSMKMMEEAMEYFFRLCMEYGVEIPSELIHTGIFGRAASTFAGELGASYRRALLVYGIDVPV